MLVSIRLLRSRLLNERMHFIQDSSNRFTHTTYYLLFVSGIDNLFKVNIKYVVVCLIPVRLYCRPRTAWPGDPGRSPAAANAQLHPLGE
jgi:hypothetical protein